MRVAALVGILVANKKNIYYTINTLFNNQGTYCSQVLGKNLDHKKT